MQLFWKSFRVKCGFHEPAKDMGKTEAWENSKAVSLACLGSLTEPRSSAISAGQSCDPSRVSPQDVRVMGIVSPGVSVAKVHNLRGHWNLHETPIAHLGM